MSRVQILLAAPLTRPLGEIGSRVGLKIRFLVSAGSSPAVGTKKKIKKDKKGVDIVLFGVILNK
jgi:hypothetical protein